MNSDATYNNAVTFSKPVGSYSAIATAYTNWFLTNIACIPFTAVNLDLASGTVTINATDGVSINCTFTQQRAATVRATKYNDLNNSGSRNSIEPYLGGWTMTLYDAQNNMLAGGVTNTSRRVDFTGRLPGTDKVCETLTPGWTNTQPRSQDLVLGKPCHTVITQPGKVSILPFGNRLSAAIQGASSSQEADAEIAEGIMIEDDANTLEDPSEAPAP